MTSDELRRLAEIAGLKLSAVGELLQSGSRFYRPNNEGKYYTNPIIPVYDWQPHIRIEQAMIVADAFTAFYVGKDNGQYFCRLAVTNGDLIKYLPKVYSINIPLAICRAALAEKEDK